jgi:imidazoleglycerol-phosphate dehydratase
MDEALILCTLDCSGRMYLKFTAEIPTQKIGTFDTELVEEFFLGFARASGVTLHLKQLDGENSHHIVEAMFKAFGRALSQAVAIDPDYADEIPSTKGVLS